MLIKHFHALAIAAALVSCGGKKDDKDKPAAAPPAPTGSGSPAVAVPTPAPPPPAAEAIDVCSFAKREDVEAIVGKLSKDPEPSKRMGSLLGQCTYSTDAGMATVMARPAGEYDGTVRYSKPTTAIAGLGEAATHTEKAGVQSSWPARATSSSHSSSTVPRVSAPTSPRSSRSSPLPVRNS